MAILKSGWCLRPYGQHKAQHDLCPKNFTTNSCTCDCGHAGEKPTGWNRGFAVMGPTEKSVLKVDTPAQGVYTRDIPQPRKSAEGAKEALQALYK